MSELEWVKVENGFVNGRPADEFFLTWGPDFIPYALTTRSDAAQHQEHSTKETK